MIFLFPNVIIAIDGTRLKIFEAAHSENRFSNLIINWCVETFETFDTRIFTVFHINHCVICSTNDYEFQQLCFGLELCTYIKDTCIFNFSICCHSVLTIFYVVSLSVYRWIVQLSIHRWVDVLQVVLQHVFRCLNTVGRNLWSLLLETSICKLYLLPNYIYIYVTHDRYVI